MEPFLVFLLVVAIVIVWGYQFIQLMMLSDSDFPGKYDKILWVAAFLCVFIVTPFAFMYWKQAYLSLRSHEQGHDE